MLIAVISILGSVIWLSILLLPWRPWSTRERLEARKGGQAIDLSRVTVLIPARNEAATIAETLAALHDQHPALPVILVDDQSQDGTADIAQQSSLSNLTVLSGTPPPEGWTGKLWALEQGRRRVQTPLVLLLDADIQLKPGMLAALVEKMEQDQRDLVSIMAHLRMQTFWENLLIPAFIYFFKLLYPFALGNSRRFPLGVAAGGCVLVQRHALERIGGFAALSGALIDDCTLAQKLKRAGFFTWIGLSRAVVSNRGYDHLGEIWSMVARSAYTQLQHSILLLLACTLLMLSMFVGTPLGLFANSSRPLQVLSLLGTVAMLLSYAPTLGYYRRSFSYTLLFPLAGLLYLAMTWTSALRSWRGQGSKWKGRSYTKTSPELSRKA